MSTRPLTFGALVLVAIVLIGAAGCSNGTASVNNVADKPGTDTPEPSSEDPCDATATVSGRSYHVVSDVPGQYAPNPARQVEGSATDCTGDSGRSTTFHAIPKVDPALALCGLVDGRWRVFLADSIDLPVPADGALARILGE